MTEMSKVPGATRETDFVKSTAEEVERREAFGAKIRALHEDALTHAWANQKRRMIGHVMWWPKPEGR